MIFKKKNTLLLIFILLIGATLRFVILFNTDNIWDMEALGRIQQTVEWIHDKDYHHTPTRAPLHFYLIRLVLNLHYDPFLIPRVLNTVLGILSVYVLYRLVKLFYDGKTSLIAALLISLYPLHVKLSTVSSGIIPFLFFLFLSLYFYFMSSTHKFFKFKNLNFNLALLFLSSLFLILASKVRFEGWLIGVIYIFFFIKNKKFNYMINFCFFTIIICILFIPLNFNTFLDSFFVFMNRKVDLPWQLNLKERIVFWPLFLYKDLGIVVFITGLWGIYHILKNKLNNEFLHIFLIYFFLFYITLIFNYVANDFYKGPILACFFIPLSAVGINEWFKKLNYKKMFITGIIASIFIIFSVRFVTDENSPLEKISKSNRNILCWLEKNMEQYKKIFFLNEGEVLFLYSRIKFIKPDKLIFLSSESEDIGRYFHQYDISGKILLIYSKDTKINALIDRKNYDLNPKFTTEKFILSELIYEYL